MKNFMPSSSIPSKGADNSQNFATNKMFKSLYPIYLASSSPRRHSFFDDLGFDYSIINPKDKESSPFEGELASDYVMRVAKAKAVYGLNYLNSINKHEMPYVIIGADTAVSIDGHILGKPEDSADALSMLKMLVGRKHIVTTGMHIIKCITHQNSISFSVTTDVTMGAWDDETLKAYVNCGESFDKAGAYAIQGKGAFLVDSIDGCWANVVGLPVKALVQHLLEANIIESENIFKDS